MALEASRDRLELANKANCLELALDAAADHLKVKAVVRNTFGFHYGFEFVELSGEARRAIMRVVAASTPPAEPPKPEKTEF